MTGWKRVASVSGVLAGLAWLIPWYLGTSAAPVFGVPMGVVAPLSGMIVGMVGTSLFQYFSDAWHASLARAEGLERRVASLEQAKNVPPFARVRFEYNTRDLRARLYVTNFGDDAEFWTPLMVDGGLAARLDGPIFGRWEHTDQPTTSIPKGETRTLCLARLNLSTFPFAQWELHASREDASPVVLPALHTSVIGGALDAHAPTILIEVALLSTPAATEGPRTWTIALNPFEAQSVRF